MCVEDARLVWVLVLLVRSIRESSNWDFLFYKSHSTLRNCYLELRKKFARIVAYTEEELNEAIKLSHSLLCHIGVSTFFYIVWLTFVLLFYGRLLFPDLPNEDYVHLATDTVTGVSNHCTEEGITSSALLHPLLFPRLYPTLFTLYALRNEKQDSMYWERITQLNKRSDFALMTYVGMKR